MLGFITSTNQTFSFVETSKKSISHQKKRCNDYMTEFLSQWKNIVILYAILLIYLMKLDEYEEGPLILGLNERNLKTLGRFFVRVVFFEFLKVFHTNLINKNKQKNKLDNENFSNQPTHSVKVKFKKSFLIFWQKFQDVISKAYSYITLDNYTTLEYQETRFFQWAKIEILEKLKNYNGNTTDESCLTFFSKSFYSSEMRKMIYRNWKEDLSKFLQNLKNICKESFVIKFYIDHSILYRMAEWSYRMIYPWLIQLFIIPKLSFSSWHSVDPLVVFRGLIYVAISSFNLYGYIITKHELSFDDVQQVTTFMKDSGNLDLLFQVFWGNNMDFDTYCEHVDYFLHNLGKMGAGKGRDQGDKDTDQNRMLDGVIMYLKKIQPPIQFRTKNIYDLGKNSNRTLFEPAFNGSEPGFPSITHWYETLAKLYGFPSLRRLGISDHNTRVVWHLVNYITKNPIGFETFYWDYSTEAYQTYRVNHTATQLFRFSNFSYPVHSTPLRSQLPVFIESMATFVAGPHTNRDTETSELLKAHKAMHTLLVRFPGEFQPLECEVLRSLFTNFTIPSINRWYTIVDQALRMPNKDVMKYSRWCKFPLVPSLKTTLVHPDQITEVLTMPIKELYTNGKFSPDRFPHGWSRRSQKDFIHSAFSTVKTRYWKYKIVELNDNINSFDDRMEKLEEFLKSIFKARARTHNRVCPVYGSAKRCEEVLVILRYGIVLPLIGACTLFFQRSPWYTGKSADVYTTCNWRLESGWALGCMLFYHFILTRTAKGYRFFFNESRQSSFFASIPDFVGEASFRAALVILTTIVKNELLFPAILGVFLETLGRFHAMAETTLEFPEPAQFRERETLVYNVFLAISSHFYTIYGRGSIAWYFWLGYLIFYRTIDPWHDILDFWILPSYRRLFPICYKFVAWDVICTCLYTVVKMVGQEDLRIIEP